jgi:hypothetical protein
MTVTVSGHQERCACQRIMSVPSFEPFAREREPSQTQSAYRIRDGLLASRERMSARLCERIRGRRAVESAHPAPVTVPANVPGMLSLTTSALTRSKLRITAIL